MVFEIIAVAWICCYLGKQTEFGANGIINMSTTMIEATGSLESEL